MGDLRADQLELLAQHRGRAYEAFAAALAAYDGKTQLAATPEGQTLLALPGETLVSVAVSAAGASVEARRRGQEEVASQGTLHVGAADAFVYVVLAALSRRRLPFNAADAELILDLGTSTMDPDRIFGRCFEVISLGVSAVRTLMRSGPAPPAVVAALERAGAALERQSLPSASNAADLRQRVRGLIADCVPAGLLDLSVIDGPDAWGSIASDVLRRHAEQWDGIHTLLGLLATPAGTRPSQAWRRRAGELAPAYPGYGELLRELLEPILEIDLTPSGTLPPMWLLAPGNELLVRGATWALVDVDEAWVVPLAGRLGRRCATPSPHPTVTTALARTVAGAAVETLAMIGTPAAEEELRKVRDEVRRRDLLKRIATILGERADDARARAEGVRLDRQRRSAASAFARKELVPELAAAGFDHSVRRAFWRTVEDRVELLEWEAHRGGVTLELGIWFRFVPRWDGVSAHDGHEYPMRLECDLRGTVHAWYDDLGSAARKAEDWFARFGSLPVVVRRMQDGARSEELSWGFGPVDSPRTAFLIGYLALECGDLATARTSLRSAATRFRARLELHPDEATPAREAWLRRIEADAAG